MIDRRHAERVAKARTKKFLLRIMPEEYITPKHVGKWTSTHRRPCSCNLCSGPSIKTRRLTKDERKLYEARS